MKRGMTSDNVMSPGRLSCVITNVTTTRTWLSHDTGITDISGPEDSVTTQDVTLSDMDKDKDGTTVLCDWEKIVAYLTKNQYSFLNYSMELI